MKVALVTDWIYGGGSEMVVQEMHRLYPDAPIYASYCSSEWRERLDNKVVTGYLQCPPFKQLRRFLPLLRQWWFWQLNLRTFDLVISITGNGEAKFVRVPNGKHISYCHTPVHFYWRHYDRYLKHPSMRPRWLARVGLKMLVKPLRKRDFAAAQRVDYFIANSTHIRSDIKKFYGRDSEVIHPPIDVSRFKTAKEPAERKGFITMGRQVPLKKTEIIIEACKQLQQPLIVAGNGPEHSRLVGITGPTVHFKTDITDEEMPNELASAVGFLFAGYEDFGMAPVEAMASGTPVIGYKAGGTLDYIIPGKTGEFFAEQTAESLAQAIENFRPATYKAEQIQKYAEKFSSKAFRSQFAAFIATASKKKG